MKEVVEIRWHGRGGQGTVTAAKVFADTCLGSGQFVQAFPEYGPERAGAPLQAYNRISPKELRKHCPVSRPDIVVVVDTTLLDNIDVTAGTTDQTVFLVNSGKNMERLKENIKPAAGQKVFCVDGSRIAMDAIGRPLPNAPMVGALAKVSGIAALDLEVVVKAVEKSFGKKFPQKIVDGNKAATKKGWEEVREW